MPEKKMQGKLEALRARLAAADPLKVLAVWRVAAAVVLMALAVAGLAMGI